MYRWLLRRLSEPSPLIRILGAVLGTDSLRPNAGLRTRPPWRLSYRRVRNQGWRRWGRSRQRWPAGYGEWAASGGSLDVRTLGAPQSGGGARRSGAGGACLQPAQRPATHLAPTPCIPLLLCAAATPLTSPTALASAATPSASESRAIAPASVLFRCRRCCHCRRCCRCRRCCQPIALPPPLASTPPLTCAATV